MLNKMYTILIVLFPILSVYQTIFNKISFADIIMIILFPIFLFFIIKKNKITIRKENRKIIAFAIYLILTMLIQCILNTGVNVISTIRFVMYMLFLVIGNEYFDLKFGIKLIKITTLLISIYVILQYIVFVLFSRTLPWYIKLFNVMDENFVLKSNSEHYMEFYRPTGVFMEPTHYAQYALIYFIYLLFSEEKVKHRVIQILIITIGILCSGSSMGLIIILISIFMMFCYNKTFNMTKKITIIFIIILGICFLLKIPYFSKIVTRVIGTDQAGLLSGAAVGYRFNGATEFLMEEKDLIYILIGTGRGTEQSYLTGIFYLLKNNGLIGLIMYLNFALYIIKRNKSNKKILAIVVLLISFGSEIIVNYGILFYYCFMIIEDTISEEKKNEFKTKHIDY